MVKYTFLLLVLVSLIHCKSNSEKLEILLLNSQKEPISNAKIYCNLWKKASNSEESSSLFSTSSDEKGIFIIDLTNVIHLDLIIQSDAYVPYLKKGYYPNGKNKFEINLVRNKGLFTASSSFNDDNKELKIGVELEKTVLNPKYKFIKYSIPNSDISIWLESTDSNLDNVFIATNSAFGISPIYSSGENSIYFNEQNAPEDGYKKRHNIDGTEIGFFIKSNLGFAKIVLNKRASTGTYPMNGGYVQFRYLTFDWIFNTNNDLSVKKLNIEKLLE